MAAENDYTRILDDLRERLPEVARQLDDEVQGGRMVSGSDLSRTDRDSRSARLKVAELQGVAKTDVAVIPYSEDEQLMLLCRALLTLANSMHGSRKALVLLADEEQVRSKTVEFTQDDAPPQEGIDLRSEVLAASRALELVQELLGPYFDRGVLA